MLPSLASAAPCLLRTLWVYLMELGQGGCAKWGWECSLSGSGPVWRTLEAVTRGQVAHTSDSVVVTSGHSQGLQSPGPQTCSDSPQAEELQECKQPR